MGQVASAAAPSKDIPAGCPMHNQQQPQPQPASQPPSGCPVVHDDNTKINPLNNMPELKQEPLSPGQAAYLPTDRTTSSIPRPQDTNNPEGYGRGTNWEYPSPQQFYNALVRKGWETPEESVEDMVAIHNFLNEEAWNEIKKWEKRQSDGQDKLQLAQFSGRPGDYTPKARLQILLSSAFPSRFHDEPPFDRHDWYVRRNDSQDLVRYVIDYYGAPPTPEGMPVFHLDVRPALDSPASILERIKVGTARCWRTATGMPLESIDNM